MLTEQFLREQGVLPRGLAHPVIFSQQFGGQRGEGAGGGAGAAGAGAGSGPQAAGGGGSGGGGGGELTPWDPNNVFEAALQGGLCRAFVGRAHAAL